MKSIEPIRERLQGTGAGALEAARSARSLATTSNATRLDAISFHRV